MSSVFQPNIVVFFTDQQRWDTCGCYGQKMPVTPNLDRMAAEGVLFERAFTCQPVCGPARACLQTGRYATELGCHTNHRMLPTDADTIARRFRAAGYETGYIGKWHLASFGPTDGPDSFRDRPVPPQRRGGYDEFWLASDVLEFTSHGYDGYMFDDQGNKRLFPPGRYRADAQSDWVLEYLASRSGEQPFFLFISYIEPHHQNDHGHFEGPAGSKERFANFTAPGDLAGADGDWRQEMPDYLGCCNSLDENLGRVRNELLRLGIADNTLVLFTSDHGCHFRTRNDEYKRSCHEASIRIPMVACGPGFTGGKVVNELVSLIDVPPTLLRAGGAEPTSICRGRALQELIDGTARDWPKEVFLQISESQVGRAIRTDRWKYSVAAPYRNGWKDPDSEIYIEDCLYDLHADPYELRNLVSDPSLAHVRASLAETLKRRMREAGEASETGERDETGKTDEVDEINETKPRILPAR